MASDGVVGDTETALVVRLMEPHVDPCVVLLVSCLVVVSGALLKQCRCAVVVDVLLPGAPFGLRG
jgi:hypothetical protein